MFASQKSLMPEIAFFINFVCLRLIVSSNTPSDLKVRLLKGLNRLCADFQLVLRIFLHYDCSICRPAVIRRMTGTLTKQITVSDQPVLNFSSLRSIPAD